MLVVDRVIERLKTVKQLATSSPGRWYRVKY